MDAARKRNPIMHSIESLKQAEKTLAPRVPGLIAALSAHGAILSG
jgi:hypothetical protein